MSIKADQFLSQTDYESHQYTALHSLQNLTQMLRNTDRCQGPGMRSMWTSNLWTSDGSYALTCSILAALHKLFCCQQEVILVYCTVLVVSLACAAVDSGPHPIVRDYTRTSSNEYSKCSHVRRRCDKGQHDNRTATAWFARPMTKGKGTSTLQKLGAHPTHSNSA